MSPGGHDEQLQSLVLRNRDEPSPKLAIDWALLRLLDQSHCDQLRDDLASASADGWERRIAHIGLDKSLPDRPGLYMFVWRPWLTFHVEESDEDAKLLQILYVGLAGASRFEGDPNASTLKRRFKAYKKHFGLDPKLIWSKIMPAGRDQLLNRYFALRPLEYWFVVIEDADLLDSLERRLIATLNPPCNTQDTPLLVQWAGPAQPAFR